MRRWHLIEIEDQTWCPRAIRDGVTEYLQFILAVNKTYDGIAPKLSAALKATRMDRIVDLCSGAGGPWYSLLPALAKNGIHVSVCLTDKYPNLETFKWSKRMPNYAISYYPQPVDAAGVPGELAGLRTMFTAFHHFRPETARAVLTDAVRQRQAIGIFELTERSIRGLLLMLAAPLVLLVVSPFIRPFRGSRLFWTYLIPVIPAVTLFDGLVSCLRTYGLQELKSLTEALEAKDYHFEVGTAKGNRSPIPITYLIGIPSERFPPVESWESESKLKLDEGRSSGVARKPDEPQ